MTITYTWSQCSHIHFTPKLTVDIVPTIVKDLKSMPRDDTRMAHPLVHELIEQVVNPASDRYCQESNDAVILLLKMLPLSVKLDKQVLDTYGMNAVERLANRHVNIDWRRDGLFENFQMPERDRVNLDFGLSLLCFDPDKNAVDESLKAGVLESLKVYKTSSIMSQMEEHYYKYQ